MMISDLFLYKKGSPNRGLVWDSIVENLNLIETPVFGLKDKRSVRDRWTLLKTKYKKKTREEEAASGIDVDDLTERESLIEELCDKEESFVDVDSVRKQKEKINAEDIRMKALERMGETKKRTSREFDGDSKPKKTRRGISELVEYLKQRSSTDSELRREELAIKKNEQEIQKQTASQAAAQQLEMMRIMQNKTKKRLKAKLCCFSNNNNKCQWHFWLQCKSLRRNKEILFTGYVLCS
jgi:hypothetical protein